MEAYVSPLVPRRAARTLSRSLIGSLSGFSTLLALVLVQSGCVAAKHYEEARSIVNAEAAAHQRTSSRLAAAQTRITKLEADLAEKKRLLASGEEAAAQGRLNEDTLRKEREEASVLMAQLQSDLARTGSHLKVFSDEKLTLEQKLKATEARLESLSQAEKNLAVMIAAARDLTLSLAEPVGSGAVELRARDGEVIVSVPDSELFQGDTLRPEAAVVVAGVSRVAALHSGLGVIVRVAPGSPAPRARLEALAAALTARGVNNVSVILPEAKPGETKPAPAASSADKESDSDATDWAPPLADGATEATVAAEFEIAFSAARR
jgi:hypothetical protein